MIGFLRGSVLSVDSSKLLLDVGGVGYEVNFAASMSDNLPSIGEDIRVYTHMVVSDSAISLYGFLREDELNMFRMLLGVSGVGPKAAQSILSTLGSDDLRFALFSADAKAISKAPGIGNKTAQRVILELKDKVSEFSKEPESTQVASAGESGATKEASEALVALGYSPSEAYKAVRAVPNVSDMSTDQILSAALKFMTR